MPGYGVESIKSHTERLLLQNAILKHQTASETEEKIRNVNKQREIRMNDIAKRMNRGLTRGHASHENSSTDKHDDSLSNLHQEGDAAAAFFNMQLAPLEENLASLALSKEEGRALLGHQALTKVFEDKRNAQKLRRSKHRRIAKTHRRYQGLRLQKNVKNRIGEEKETLRVGRQCAKEIRIMKGEIDEHEAVLTASEAEGGEGMSASDRELIQRKVEDARKKISTRQKKINDLKRNDTSLHRVHHALQEQRSQSESNTPITSPRKPISHHAWRTHVEETERKNADLHKIALLKLNIKNQTLFRRKAKKDSTFKNEDDINATISQIIPDHCDTVESVLLFCKDVSEEEAAYLFLHDPFCDSPPVRQVVWSDAAYLSAIRQLLLYRAGKMKAEELCTFEGYNARLVQNAQRGPEGSPRQSVEKRREVHNVYNNFNFVSSADESGGGSPRKVLRNRKVRKRRQVVHEVRQVSPQKLLSPIPPVALPDPPQHTPLAMVGKVVVSFISDTQYIFTATPERCILLNKGTAETTEVASIEYTGTSMKVNNNLTLPVPTKLDRSEWRKILHKMSISFDLTGVKHNLHGIDKGRQRVSTKIPRLPHGQRKGGGQNVRGGGGGGGGARGPQVVVGSTEGKVAERLSAVQSQLLSLRLNRAGRCKAPTQQPATRTTGAKVGDPSQQLSGSWYAPLTCFPVRPTLPLMDLPRTMYNRKHNAPSIQKLTSR